MTPSRTLRTFAGLALAHTASAQTLVWNNPTGGFASIAGNWAPAQVPTAAVLCACVGRPVTS